MNKSMPVDLTRLPKVQKHTMGRPRQADGHQPACTEAFPGKAAVFGGRDALLREARRRTEQNPRSYFNQMRGEKEAGLAKRCGIVGGLERGMRLPRITFWRGLLVLVPAAAFVLRFTNGLGAATPLNDRFAWGLWIGLVVFALAVRYFGVFEPHPAPVAAQGELVPSRAQG